MSSKKNIIWAVISARSGSQSIKDKNIFKLNKRPMIAYSIAAAKKSKLISRVIVSTDSLKYKKVAEYYGAEVPFLRPKKISKNTSTDIELFNHLIRWCRENESFAPEYFAHLRPTTPIRNPNIIDKAIKSFIGTKYTALRSVQKMSSTSYKTFEIEDKKLKSVYNKSFNVEKSNLPRQSYKETYEANGHIDIVRASMIDKNIIHGNRVKALVTEFTPDIDGVEDLKYLQYLIKEDPEVLNFLFNR